MRIGDYFKSKTVWGSVLVAGGWLLSQPHVGAPEIAQAVGGVVTSAGVRGALGKIAQAVCDALMDTRVAK